MHKLNTSLFIIFAMCCLLCSTLVDAVDEIGIQIGSIQFDELNANNVNVEFGFSNNGLTFTLSSPSIELAEAIGTVHQLKLSCQKLALFSEHAHCEKGVLQFQHKQLGKQHIYFVSTAQPNAVFYQLKLANIKLADARFKADLKLHQQDWQLTANTPEASLRSVLNALIPYLTEQQAQQLSEWQFDGKANIAINANGAAEQLSNANLNLDLSELALTETTGRYVAETVTANFKTILKQKQQGFYWDSDLSLTTGQAYAEPIFIDFSETPIGVTSQGNFNQASQYLSIENIEFQHADILIATASYQGDTDLAGELSVQLQQTELKGLFQHWLQPFLFDAGLADLELAGEIALNLRKQYENVSVQTDLIDVYVDDQQNRFGVYSLNGQLAWTNHQQPVHSQLSWQGGYLFQLPLGQSSVSALVEKQRFRLTENWYLPLLDGAIDIQQFELFTPPQGEMEWSFKAELTPISMTDLTRSFGWPTMNGKLSGSIPKVSYRNHQIDIDGALKVNLFNGSTVIKDLRLTEPFGSLPQLYANVDLKNIDLETLTSTFDFGKITGKLEGHISDLRLANWQPVAFDAAFYTPADDDSRRRISQQAVNNLSEVSGGASGLLSRSFLRFFENFSYKKLGLSCKLVNDVCEMDGVKSAENGYYLVEGGGMPPQINVMGYTRRVNWPDLLARLKAVSNAEGVVVE